ncbi:MAG: OmpA family protein [Phycisphaeraceae bacterium]|nr:OmpA family protein [Phycisphaeraceae bacterium]
MMGKIARVVGLGLVVTGMALGGCRNVSKGEYDMVMQENQTLRDALEREKQARVEAENRNASLEQENRDMAGQLDRGRTGTGAAARSGGRADFSGEGVTTSMRGGDVVVSVAGDVLFDSGSATLKASAKRTLDGIASKLKSNYSSHTIRVEGYTDTDPIQKSGWKTNERLSGERAMAVESYLVSKGVPKNRIYFAGFGADRPKSTKKDSRRVEIVILAGAE